MAAHFLQLARKKNIFQNALCNDSNCYCARKTGIRHSECNLFLNMFILTDIASVLQIYILFKLMIFDNLFTLGVTEYCGL